MCLKSALVRNFTHLSILHMFSLSDSFCFHNSMDHRSDPIKMRFLYVTYFASQQCKRAFCKCHEFLSEFPPFQPSCFLHCLVLVEQMFQTKNLALNPLTELKLRLKAVKALEILRQVLKLFHLLTLMDQLMSPCFLFPMLALILLFNVPLALSECMECKEVKFDSKKLVTF